jgi:uncharacterized protein (DUF427 family)
MGNTAPGRRVVPDMATATWNGTVIAQSDDTVIVEGNHYFPIESVDADLLAPSDHTSVCPWKGTSQYYDIVVGDATNRAAAWYYPQPKDAAVEIKDRVAFWKGVTVAA